MIGVIMSKEKNKTIKNAGFSLIELILSLVITLIILGAAVTAFTSAMSSRERESSKTDAITSTQAALNVMTREIGNAGYGLSTNGIVVADSGENQLHFRTNVDNSNSTTSDPDEDVTFYLHESLSVVRYDKNLNTTTTSGLINRISDVDFVYHNYTYNASTGNVDITSGTTPASNTARITIILTVTLPNVAGQPSGQTVKVQSDVTLRNSPYMLGQY
jgi:prepilin-type N-terminal cleavage/methylation domain-containing protein